jgi:hypothetical protein
MTGIVFINSKEELMMDELWKDIDKKLKNGSKHLKNRVENTSKKARNKTSSFADSVSETGRQFVDRISERTPEITDRTREITSKVADKTSDIVTAGKLKLKIHSLKKKADVILSELGGRSYELLKMSKKTVYSDKKIKTSIEAYESILQEIKEIEQQIEDLSMNS